MRRITAIFLLLVVLFTFYGYRLVISCFQTSQTLLIEKKVDEHRYTDDELVSVKTTLKLPYYTSSPEFERTYGSINIGGIEYEYVKRRVYHDTLELLCIPNHEKTKLQLISNELVKFPADGQATSPFKKGGSVKIYLPDFFQSFFPLLGVEEKTVPNHYARLLSNFHTSDYFIQQEKPPQAMHV